MTRESKRLPAATTRLLLDRAVEARQAYAEYLRAVAAGERSGDCTERERLASRCDAALQAWRRAHLAWQKRGEPGGAAADG